MKYVEIQENDIESRARRAHNYFYFKLRINTEFKQIPFERSKKLFAFVAAFLTFFRLT